VPAAARPRIFEKFLVEDEDSMWRFLRPALAAQGYHVVEARTGAEVLQLAASHNSDPLMLDLGLPDLDGIEVTRRLREWTQAPTHRVQAPAHAGAPRGQSPHAPAAPEGGLGARIAVPRDHGAGEHGQRSPMSIVGTARTSAARSKRATVALATPRASVRRARCTRAPRPTPGER
jgi:CheY-like chemotaxis protein